jgi:hypothetical protein
MTRPFSNLSTIFRIKLLAVNLLILAQGPTRVIVTDDVSHSKGVLVVGVDCLDRPGLLDGDIQGPSSAGP